MKNVLIIDDDQKLSDLLKEFLTGFNYDVEAALLPSLGLKALRSRTFDIVILDVMMPEMDGFKACQEIRKFSSIPIIMLTARGEVTDKIVGLELGADDYLPKPFEPRELVARMDSILRRLNHTQNSNHEIVDLNGLSINLKSHQVFLNKESVDITGMEFALLKLFVEKKGEVVSRDEIMDCLQGIDVDIFSRSVDILVSRLRSKLKDDAKNPKYIKTLRGAGYIFIGDMSRA